MPDNDFIKVHLGGDTIIYVPVEEYDYTEDEGVITIYKAPYEEENGVITIT